jgi:hypothetical protein
VCVIIFTCYNHLSWSRRFYRPNNTRWPVWRHK